MPVIHYPRIWLNFLWPPLRPLERIAIEAWIAKTDPDTRDVVQSQLRFINLVQRSAGGRVAQLYYIKSGVTVGDYPRRLEVGRDGLIIGKVEMAINGEEIVCQLVAVSGHLFSLQFDRAPRRWLSRPEIKIISVDTSARPIKPQQRELRALLPADYAEIGEVTVPQSAPAYDAAILSLDEIYDASFEDGRYWLLAEIPDVGMLGVKDQGSDRQVYMLFYDGRPATGLGNSFKVALERASRFRGD